MQHLVMKVASLVQLQAELHSLVVQYLHIPAERMFAQVYTNQLQPEWYQAIYQTVRQQLPQITVVGSSAMGVVCHENYLDETTVLSIFIFDSAIVTSHFAEYAPLEPNDANAPYQYGRALAEQALQSDNTDLQGIMLLSNPFVISSEELLRGINDVTQGTSIFGGMAGNNEQSDRSQIFYNAEVCSHAAVMVCFWGEQLRIQTLNYLGWVPFGNVMTVTETQGAEVLSINNLPAYQLYREFIDIDSDTEQFFENSVEFPLMLLRDGKKLARTPISVSDNEGLNFLVPLKPGDQVQFGYGDINTIMNEMCYSVETLRQFEPQAIMLFSCCCRLMYLRSDCKQLEVPLRELAPTAGFFSFGEIDTANVPHTVLNATLVAAAFSETPPQNAALNYASTYTPFSVKPSRDLRRLQRLMYFIERVTSQLHQTNAELQRLAQRDSLTDLFNRRTFNARLEQEFAFCQEKAQPLCIMMLDVDHFKAVNDNYGHSVGDKVLIAIAEEMTHTIRQTDLIARYGGEEFIVALSNTTLEDALLIAERLRHNIAAIHQTKQPDLPKVTCSIGLAQASNEQSIEQLLQQADDALYQAKDAGRNCVRKA